MWLQVVMQVSSFLEKFMYNWGKVILACIRPTSVVPPRSHNFDWIQRWNKVWNTEESRRALTVSCLTGIKEKMRSFTPLQWQSLCDAHGGMRSALFTQIIADALKVYSFDAQSRVMQITFSTCGLRDFWNLYEVGRKKSFQRMLTWH